MLEGGIEMKRSSPAVFTRLMRTVQILFLSALAFSVSTPGMAVADAANGHSSDHKPVYLVTKAGRIALSAIHADDVWAACGVSDSAYKIVRSFPIVHGSPDGGPRFNPSQLYCGTDTWGYRHILNEHMTQWEGLGALAGENWRDFADWAIEAGLDNPQRVDFRTDTQNDNFLYQGAFWFEDSDDNIVAKFCSQTVVTPGSRIITAYPKGNQLVHDKCAKPSWKH